MPTVSFQLLQTPRILLDGQQILLPFKKAEALLYCLAIKKTISREQAANCFGTPTTRRWPKKI